MNEGVMPISHSDLKYHVSILSFTQENAVDRHSVG